MTLNISRTLPGGAPLLARSGLGSVDVGSGPIIGDLAGTPRGFVPFISAGLGSAGPLRERTEGISGAEPVDVECGYGIVTGERDTWPAAVQTLLTRIG